MNTSVAHAVERYRILTRHRRRSNRFSTSGRASGSSQREVDVLNDEVRELNEEVRMLAGLTRTDPVTGLANRRGWDEQLARELARARRGSEPLSMALVDLDHFKVFNDAHGHQAGDRLLSEAAAAWAGQLRKVDLLCRWGGDEFGVLLPNCARHQADGVIARLAAATPHGQSCSFGVACWDGEEAPDALLARTDRGLYQSKRALAASRR